MLHIQDAQRESGFCWDDMLVGEELLLLLIQNGRGKVLSLVHGLQLCLNFSYKWMQISMDA